MDWRPPGWKYLPKRGIERWLDDLFFAFSEVMILSLPVSFTLVMGSDPGATLGAIVAVLTSTLAIALVRSDRTPLSAIWPRFRPSTVLARVLWYNAALAVAAYVGAAIDSVLVAGLGTVVFAAAVSVGAVATLPQVASRTTELLSWWTWGRPPE